MKKKIMMLVIACLGFDVFATTCAQTDSESFAPYSNKRINCAITNNGEKKYQYNVQIFQKMENGEQKNVSDNFNLVWNNIYIAPKTTENVEIVPAFDEETRGVEFEIRVVNLDTKETKTIPLQAVIPVQKEIKLKSIERNSSGIFKAVVAN
jgi:hypothetical protein